MTDSTAPADVSRRRLLQSALAASALAAVPVMTAKPAFAGPTPPAEHRKFDATNPRFTVAVLPDTQYLFDADSTDPAPLTETFKYLLDRRSGAEVAFMTHLGDITEHGRPEEIAAAGRAFRAIDRRLPYSVLAGNHDINSSTTDQRGESPYLKEFGPSRFRRTPSFGGASPDGYNSFHTLTAAGRPWLILALDWRISEEGMAWTQSVLDAHRSVPTILTTHELAYADDAGKAQLSDYGQRLWDRVIRGNDQIFLTLNGHFWPPGRTVLTNDAGHDVHVHITNYQDRYYGGGAMIRTYGFDLIRNAIDVETFCPWFLAADPHKRNELESETVELTSDVDRFSLDIDFDARFAGFAPVPPRPARPAKEMIGRDTAAYWRFDDPGLPAAGAAIGAATIIRDQTGHGNDVSVSRLNNSDPGVLTASDSHHPAQPAHASLRFDGGQSPDRGAVLQTGPNAPINSATFDRGYTIELFVRLPDPFEGNHAFMGVLSWETVAAEAGKTNGYSPKNESVCSINISSERFVQFVVYPQGQDASPTSWSHALVPGAWRHLAVTNNRRMSTMWVDGSPIVRNPTQRSTGIANRGKPFAIGATQFGGRFGQGFYGSIGDVRITARELAPQEFMAPFGTPDVRRH